MDLTNKVIYQIYPKSFKDTTGNGFGDLRGVIEKLDYLQKLGIDMIWMNPFYPSPQNDNGYDVSNYCAIDPLFGSMEDFEELVREAQKRHINIMLDMVFNHTSTEHEWFKKALAGDKYYQDFYYLREPKEDGSVPTNWESKFGGSAWAPFGNTGLYYLHLYDVTQADLNWHNPNVRKALQEVVNFWLEKGVKGFRFDVLNVIGKDEVLIDSTGGPGSSQEKSLYTDTPIVHEWIKELNQASFGQRDDIVTVGEMSSTTIENGVRYTNPVEKELSMIFSFHHLKVDYDNGEKWSNPPFNFIELKTILDDWQKGMSDGQGWNALFLNNHDQPRSNNRFGDVDNYPYETQTMLAQTIQLLRGTPYIYQGEEIGMTDPQYQALSDFNDIETHNNYDIMVNQRGISHDDAMAIIRRKSRDNSRTPMQWDNTENAGFSTGNPWLSVPNNYTTINVANELNRDGIFKFYQQLIRLKHENDVIAKGTYEGLLLDHPSVMAYVRTYENTQILVLSHFYAGEIELALPEMFHNKTGHYLIGNGEKRDVLNTIHLTSYETIALIFEK